MTVTLRNVDNDFLRVLKSLSRLDKNVKIDATLDEVPNARTLAAMREADEIEAHPDRYKSYSCAEDLFEDLLR